MKEKEFSTTAPLQGGDTRNQDVSRQDEDFIVVIMRRDEPGYIDFSSPGTLNQAIQEAESFLRDQTSSLVYVDSDISIQRDTNRSIRLTIQQARASH